MERHLAPGCWLVVAALLPLPLVGCQEDLCKQGQPAFEVTLALGPGVDAAGVKSVRVAAVAAGLMGYKTFPINNELADRETSVDFVVGSAGEGGFSAEIGAAAQDAKGAILASAARTFAATGDACNFFHMTLRVPGTMDAGPADGSTIVDAPQTDAKPAKPCPGMTCPLQCHSSWRRCNRLRPSNFDPQKFHTSITAGLTFTGLLGQINTDTGAISDHLTKHRDPNIKGVSNGIYWDTLDQEQKGGRKLSVFGIASLDVRPGAIVTVIGTHPLALYVKGNVTIEGQLKASADGGEGMEFNPGPGGYGGGPAATKDGEKCHEGGEGKGGTGKNNYSGGGGGGHGAAGGKGGDAWVNLSKLSKYPGGAGGKAAVDGAPLIPLIGGCGGGAGSGGGGQGGGGGGAIQISANGKIKVPGMILASGAGGRSSENGTGLGTGGGGGGGGAGGAILLEGISIEVAGVLAANGGAGGVGCKNANWPNQFNNYTARHGQDGQPGPTAAKGGHFPLEPAKGGDGGARDHEAGHPGYTEFRGGGGGGAVGHIRLNAHSSINVSKSVSPAASISKKINIW